MISTITLAGYLPGYLDGLAGIPPSVRDFPFRGVAEAAWEAAIPADDDEAAAGDFTLADRYREARKWITEFLAAADGGWAGIPAGRLGAEAPAGHGLSIGIDTGRANGRVAACGGYGNPDGKPDASGGYIAGYLDGIIRRPLNPRAIPNERETLEAVRRYSDSKAEAAREAECYRVADLYTEAGRILSAAIRKAEDEAAAADCPAGIIRCAQCALTRRVEEAAAAAKSLIA